MISDYEYLLAAECMIDEVVLRYHRSNHASYPEFRMILAAKANLIDALHQIRGE